MVNIWLTFYPYLPLPFLLTRDLIFSNWQQLGSWRRTDVDYGSCGQYLQEPLLGDTLEDNNVSRQMEVQHNLHRYRLPFKV